MKRCCEVVGPMLLLLVVLILAGLGIGSLVHNTAEENKVIREQNKAESAWQRGWCQGKNKP